MSKSIRANKDLELTHIFFVLSLLLIPAADYVGYYSILLIVFFAYSFNGRLYIDIYAKLTVIVFVFLYIFTYLRSISLFFDSFTDFAELVRFMPFVLFSMFHGRIKNISWDSVIYSMQIYISIDGILSICQFFGFDNFIMSELSNIYNSKSHAETALEWASVRALGLSAGPASHGSILVFIFTSFSTTWIFRPNSIRFGLFFVFFAALITILSQSKAAILSLFSIFILLFFYQIFFKKFGGKSLLFLLLGVCFALIFLSYSEEFHQVEKLFGFVTGENNVSSFDERIYKWIWYFSFYSENPILTIFGFGRAFHGDEGRVYDSDYVYFAIVHGLLFAVFIYLFIFIFFMRQLYMWRTSSHLQKILFFLLIGSCISGIAISSISDPKVSTLVALFLRILVTYKREVQYA